MRGHYCDGIKVYLRRGMLIGGALIAGSIVVLASSLAGADPVLVDDFNDNSLDPAIWGTWILGTGPTVNEVNQRLEFDIPATSSDDPEAGIFWGLVGSPNLGLIGDFDLQVDFDLLLWPFESGVRVGLLTTASEEEGAFGASVQRTSYGSASDFPGYPRDIYGTHFADGPAGITATSDLTGTLRQVRVGNVLTGYYMGPTGWVELNSAPTTTTDPVGFFLEVWSNDAVFTDQRVTVAFDNFIINSGTLIPEPSTATLFGLGLVGLAAGRRRW